MDCIIVKVDIRRIELEKENEVSDYWKIEYYRGSNLIQFMGYRWVMGQNKSILTADRTTFYLRKHFNVTD